MKKYISTILLLSLFIMAPSTFGQENDSITDTTSLQEDIAFTYNVLPSELGQSRFDVSHDSLTFRLFYVDIECNTFSYVFKHEGKSLIVQRVTENGAECDKDSEQLFAFEGTLLNLPKGKLLFELESVIGSERNSLFREVLVVR